MDPRQAIKRVEDDVRSEFDPGRFGVYGVGHGYKALSDYLRGKRDLDKAVKGQLHEYRVFLGTMRTWVDKSEVTSDDIIFFSPSRGTGSQVATVPSLFLEPALPVYPEQKLWKRHQSNFHHLKSPDDDGPTRHTKPDLLLMGTGVDKLPWTARVQSPAVDESTLMTWCAQGDYDKVREELGTDAIPSTLRECYRAVQTTDKREDPDDSYEDWEECRTDARYIVESKHSSLTEDDYSQVLWYGLAYKTDLVIVSRENVTDQRFKEDLNRLPVDVEIVEEYRMDMSIEEANKKLSPVFT